jgi:hypothetical protein
VTADTGFFFFELFPAGLRDFFAEETDFLDFADFETLDFELVPLLLRLLDGSAPRGAPKPRKRIAAKAAAEIPNRLCTDGIIRTGPGAVNPKSSWGSIIYAASA